MKARTKLLPTALATVAIAVTVPLAAPSGAIAAESTVAGLGASALTLNVATPASVLLLNHSAAATTDAPAAVLVTSTVGAWRLDIADKSGTAQPGHMYKHDGLVECLAAPAGDRDNATFLANPLEWQRQGGAPFAALSAADTLVDTGGLLPKTVLVDFRQELGATDAIAADDCFKVAVTYTVTATP